MKQRGFATMTLMLSALAIPRSGRGFAIIGRNRVMGWSRQLQHSRVMTVFSSSQAGGDVGDDKRLFAEEVNIIYDSKCNVCKLEIDFLRRRDERLASKRAEEGTNASSPSPQPRLRFTDLESGNYDSKDPANGGVTYEVGMASMHAITHDGKVINGVPVFQLAYQQVNLGWLFAITKIPWVKKIADRGYNIFAKYRTRITRGQSVETLVEAYREKIALEQQQEADNCEACEEKATK